MRWIAKEMKMQFKCWKVEFYNTEIPNRGGILSQGGIS